VVSTGVGSATKLVFRDGTELTLGENADVTLDEFVYDSGAKSSFVLNVTKGALRFVSGDLPSSAYKIKTPVATLGIRGTDIEILVSRTGLTRLFVRQGMAVMGNGFGRSVLIPRGFSSVVEPTGGSQPATVSTPQPGRDSELLLSQETMQSTLDNPPQPQENNQGEEEVQDVADSGASETPDGAGNDLTDALQFEGLDTQGNIVDAPPGNVDPAVQNVMNRARGMGEVPANIVNAVAGGGGQQQMADFLTRGNPDSQTVAARAVALSQRLGADPRLRGSSKLLNANSSIGNVAANAMCSPRVVRMAFDNDYTPPAGALAFDMGGWNTPVADGFQRVTPTSPAVRGASLQAMDNQGEGAVLQDVITGLSGLDLDVPNGDYNVILVTAEGVAADMKTPFGASFAVNGQSYTLGSSNSAEWLDTGRLSRTSNSPAPASVPVAGFGGGIQLGSTVTNGQLRLDFKGNSLGGAVSAVIVEPLESQSSLNLQGQAQGGSPGGDQGGLDECLELEFVTEAALAVVADNSGLATAAGSAGGGGTTTTNAAPPNSPDVPNRTLSLTPVVGPTAASNT
jgi:hypothetical protein